MDNGTADTSDLIRALSRRQRKVSFAITILAIGSLLLAWWVIANDHQSDELINLAGRQRMLSQRMALHVVLRQHESDQATQRKYLDLVSATATEFEQAHERLAATVRQRDANTPIHSVYFGPAGNVDAESRHYLSLVRAAVAASVPAKPTDGADPAKILDVAGSHLLEQLDEATTIFQRNSEQTIALLLRLLMISTLLMVALVAFGLFRVFRPLIGLLASDIAARDKAENDLKESEERFKAFSESSSDWFWETDAQHRFNWIHNTESVSAPLPLERVRGKTRVELRAGVEKAAVEKWRAYEADLDARRPFRDLEYQFGADDQALRWVSVSGQPFFDSRGNFLGYRGTAKYIQARKDMEASLRQQDEQTRALLVEHETTLNNALVGIVHLRHRRVTSCNRRLEEIFGYGPGELIGESSRVFYDTDQTFKDIGVSAYRAVAEGRNFSTEMMLKRKDGSLFRGALNGRAIDPAQPQEGSIWIYADISERHHAEQEVHKLLQAVEQSPVSIIITSREGLIEYVNPRFSRVSGYSPEEVLGRNPRLLQSGEIPAATYRELWQTILAGKEWHGILRNKCKNGELLWEDVSISPIIDDANQITHFLAVKEDITARKRSEDELEQYRAHLEDLVALRTAELDRAKQQAEAANVAKSAFLANMSHEIRTPMNGILGMAHLLRREGVTPRQAERLDQIDTAAEHLLSVINDILDISKIEAGKFVLEETPVAFHSLLRNVVSILSERCASKGIRLLVQSASLPANLVGDPTRLQQALLNYAMNAVKFTETGTVTLRIREQEETAESIMLRFEVEDTGIGIPPAAMTRLFSAFEQADNSMTRKYGGTGLGLAITRHLAGLMGGEAGADSTPGVGSTFWFTARLKKGAGTIETPSTTAVDAEMSIGQRHSGRRVLVADDEPINREIARLQLNAAGLVVDTAEDGAIAIALARATAYAAILMDMQMPNLNGMEATRQIRELPGYRETPIIAMTANAFAEDKARCIEAGMNDFLTKPFRPDILFATLLRWLDQHNELA